MVGYSWTTLFTKQTIQEGEDLADTGSVTNYYNGVGRQGGLCSGDVTEHGESYHVEVQVRRLWDRCYISSMRCTCSEGRLCRHCAALLSLVRLPDSRLYGFLVDNGRRFGMSDGEQASSEAQTKKKNAAEERKLPSLESLEALQSKTAEERKEQEEAESTYQPDPSYSYFRAEQYGKQVKMRPEVKNRAARFLQSGDIAEVRVRYVESDAEKEGGTVGHFSCVFPSTTDAAYLDVGQDEILNAGCDSWSCYGQNRRAADGSLLLCPHTAALLFYLQANLPGSGLGSSTNAAGRELLASANGGQTILGDAKDIARKTLTLEPVLSVVRGTSIAAGFRVGTQRLYKVKDLKEFGEKMESEGDMTFGRTVLHLGKVYLDEKSQRWYQFLAGVIAEERERMEHAGNYSYDPLDRKAELPLYGDRLDRFMDLLMGERAEFAFQNERGGSRDRRTLLMQEKNPDIRLEIHKDTENERGVFNGIVLSGQIPQVIEGRRTGYYDTEETFNRIGEDCYRSLKPILESEKNGRVMIRIGRAELGTFYHKVLPALKNAVNITEYDSGEIAPYLPPEPQFTIYLDTENDTVLCRAEVAYGLQILSVSDLVDEKRGTRRLESYRDRNLEGAVLAVILRYLAEYDAAMKVFFSYKDDERVFDLLSEGLDAFLALKNTDVRMTDRFRRLGLRRHVSFAMGVSLESGLLDLTVRAEDLSEEEMLDILYQYQKKRKFVKLRNGDFLKLQGNVEVEQIANLMESLHMNVKDFVKGKMHIPAYRALYLEKMLESTQGIYADRDRHFKQLIKEFKTVNDADYEIPENLHASLRSYQKEGYRWLRTLDTYRFGGILADEMGLGKTLQTIAVLLAVRNEEGSSAESAALTEAVPPKDASLPAVRDLPEVPGTPDSHTSLVVCPASLVFNWGQELARFAPALQTVLVVGTQAEREQKIHDAWKADVLVTSYDLLKRDIDRYDSVRFRFEIIDEAQYIKNAQTAAAKAVKVIHAHTRYALTGTPIENRLSELWSIFDYLMPGFLYDYSEFRSEVELPIVRDGDEEVQERLKRMVAPFVLRRKKEDVLQDLPDKLEEVRYADMDCKQRQLYDAEVLRMRRTLERQDEADFRKSKIQILAALTKIRQLCCDPLLCYSGYDGSSAKKDACMQLVESLVDGGHKALLFSQFTSMLELIEGELKARGIAYYKITGATAKKQRLALVNEFNQNDVPLFLISLKAGGTGLNLTGADVVIHYDPWWNTAAQDQATDRAHRIGQTKIVTVYKLIVKDTIEEKIQEMQEKKKTLADAILSGESMESSEITREDLLAMLD